jgi:DNA-binding NarL/FixJ family response regulator
MTDTLRIRVLTVDDHALLREGIATIIKSQPDMLLVSQASSGAEAIQRFREHRPDVTLMDLRLPDLSGIDALMAIRAEFSDARIVMLTTFEGDVEIQRALQAGARGYLLKTMPPSELADAIRQVHAGKKRVPPEIAAHLAEHMSDENLTAREIEVLRRRWSRATGIGTSPACCLSRKKPSKCTLNTSWTSLARGTARRLSPSPCAAGSFSCDSIASPKVVRKHSEA